MTLEFYYCVCSRNFVVLISPMILKMSGYLWNDTPSTIGTFIINNVAALSTNINNLKCYLHTPLTSQCNDFINNNTAQLWAIYNEKQR